jgi:hypothetical protein
MPRDISHILKNGENFKLKRFDLSDKRIQKRIGRAIYFQKLAEGRKYVDWHKLSRFYIGAPRFSRFYTGTSKNI